jgi:hypothetical protein
MNIFNITNEEKSRIVELHEVALKKHYMNEQEVKPTSNSNNKYQFITKIPLTLKNKNYGNILVYNTTGENPTILITKEGMSRSENVFNSKGHIIRGTLKSGPGAFAQSIGFTRDTLFDYNELVPVLNQGIADAIKETGLSVTPPVLGGVNV